MHGGPDSQSQHIITARIFDYLTACGDIFGLQLSRLARILSTHSPQQAKHPMAT